MIIIKDKGNNSRIFVARSNASMDTSNLYVTEKDVRRILQSYLLKGEFNEEMTKKQDNLVSGVNIKTINGNDVLGEGDLLLSNSVELTQDEYNELVANGQVDDRTIYMITDAAVNVPYATYNEMTEYVDDVLGQIDEIMKDIIG